MIEIKSPRIESIATHIFFLQNRAHKAGEFEWRTYIYMKNRFENVRMGILRVLEKNFFEIL